MARQGQHGPAGFLVAGINPYRRLDESYTGFINLVASQIGAGLANAQAYEEERRRAEALAEIDRAKTTFFSNVSHEFRTPLTLMLGPLEEALALSDGQIGPDTRSLVSVAHRNGLRLLKLVNTLLDFSRIEAGRVKASYEADRSGGLYRRTCLEFSLGDREGGIAARRSMPTRCRSRSMSTATCGRRSFSTSSPTPSNSPSRADRRNG